MPKWSRPSNFAVQDVIDEINRLKPGIIGSIGVEAEAGKIISVDIPELTQADFDAVMTGLAFRFPGSLL